MVLSPALGYKRRKRTACLTVFCTPDEGLTNSDTMKVLIFLALASVAVAAPFSYVSGVSPFFYSGSNIVPSVFTGGIPNTFSSGSTFFSGTPITYSAPVASVPAPITYSAPITYNTPVAVAPAVFPKSIAQTKGSSHIVY
ncbi:hypothetical protein FHG87_010064 [Trinorchestia longiramus]|nr:hypothetical protein FHG87_010064 [Trinorchestia longiramus]